MVVKEVVKEMDGALDPAVAVEVEVTTMPTWARSACEVAGGR